MAKLQDGDFQHLTAWCDNNLRNPDAGRERLLKFVESIDDDDELPWYLDHGWWHLADLCEAWVAG